MTQVLRPIIDANEFIRIKRMRFASLYPSTMSFVANGLLASCDYKWEKGVIVGELYDEEEFELTHDGWKSFENNNPISERWSNPAKQNPLFCIPDDASNEWLHVISLFCYRVENIDEGWLSAYITAKTRLGSMSLMYQDDYIKRSMDAFRSTVNALKKYEVRGRCNALLCKAVGVPVELPFKKGSEVRLKTGVSTAIVLSDELTFGNGPVKGACFLDRPLGETQYWNKSDLVVVKNPDI